MSVRLVKCFVEKKGIIRWKLRLSGKEKKEVNKKFFIPLKFLIFAALRNFFKIQFLKTLEIQFFKSA